MSARRRREARGVTLLEVLVMSAIGVLVMGFFYLLFVRGHAETQVMDYKLQSLESAHLVIQRVEDDLKGLVWDEAHPLEVRSENGGVANVVSFTTAEPAKDPAQAPVLRQVTYAFDPGRRTLLLDGKPCTQARLANLTFTLRTRAPGTPAATFGTNALILVATAVPDELMTKPLSEIPDRQQSTLVTAVGLPPITLGGTFDAWKAGGPATAASATVPGPAVD